MAINIHFFRKNSLEKLDYARILEHFETLANFKIFYSDDFVEIAYSDIEFGFTYRYLITKQSRVTKIYDLNPKYTNVNFLLEMPIMIPIFLAKEILTVAQKICKTFELDIYHTGIKDIEPFNLVDMLVLFEKTRSQQIEEKGLQGKITFDNEKLNVICKYQRSVDSLKEHYRHAVDVGYCTPIYNENDKSSGISYRWKVGNPAVFPPYVDYIYVEDEVGDVMLVPRADFYRILQRLFTEIKTFLPDLYVLKEKQARSAKKEYRKLKRFAIPSDAYITLRMCDVIERQKVKEE